MILIDITTDKTTVLFDSLTITRIRVPPIDPPTAPVIYVDLDDGVTLTFAYTADRLADFREAIEAGRWGAVRSASPDSLPFETKG